MYLRLCLAFLLLPPAAIRDVDGHELQPLDPAGPANVLFFITNDCPVANSYAPEIQRICSDYARRRISCTLVYSDLSVEENMSFYADLFGIVGQERAALQSRLLHMTRMEPFTKRLAGRLSGGMKQKLALMCTLLHKPRILLLDEPTNGVDPVSRRDFWTILYQLLKDGITIFMTTAYLDEAERCNRVGLMHKGKLIRCDTPENLKRDAGVDTLEAVFVQTIQAADALEAK